MIWTQQLIQCKKLQDELKEHADFNINGPVPGACSTSIQAERDRSCTLREGSGSFQRMGEGHVMLKGGFPWFSVLDRVAKCLFFTMLCPFFKRFHRLDTHSTCKIDKVSEIDRLHWAMDQSSMRFEYSIGTCRKLQGLIFRMHPIRTHRPRWCTCVLLSKLFNPSHHRSCAVRTHPWIQLWLI